MMIWTDTMIEETTTELSFLWIPSLDCNSAFKLHLL